MEDGHWTSTRRVGRNDESSWGFRLQVLWFSRQSWIQDSCLLTSCLGFFLACEVPVTREIS
jgi:hypothetical protein